MPWAEEYRRRLEEIHVAALECYAAVALGVGGSELAPGERGGPRAAGAGAVPRARIRAAHADPHRPGQQRRGAPRLRIPPHATPRRTRRHPRAGAAGAAVAAG